MLLKSSNGGIVAHVGPNVLGSTDPRSSITLARRKMEEFVNLLKQNSQAFQKASQNYIIFATFHTQATSPEHIAIFRQRLQSLNLPNAIERSYERAPPSVIGPEQAEGTL